MDKALNQTFFTKFTVSIFLALMGIWLPFVHLFFLNAGNLTLSLRVHLPLLGILSVAVVGVSLGLQTLLPLRHRLRASLALLALGIFMWAEGTLFIGNFGFLSGGFLDWGKNQYLLFLELTLVAILGFILYRFRGGFFRHAVFICGALTVSALANVVPAFQAEQSHTKIAISHTFTKDDVFQLSSDQNVLLFIIDTFQADVFAELLAENPQWEKDLSGFTFFPDATSAFPKTYTSVPNMLTGKAFDNSEPYATFRQKAYLGQSVPRVLKGGGFDVRYRAFTWQPYLAHPALVDNLTDVLSSDGRVWMQQDEFLQLFNLSVFRLTPFLLKPWVYHNNEWRITKSIFPQRVNAEPYQLDESDRKYSRGNKNWDMELLDQILAFTTVDSKKPTFRIFHFLGVHEPMVFDKELNFIGNQEQTRDTFKDQAEAMVKLLHLIFDEFKTKGVYDNSLIFVVGDHGASNIVEVGIRKDGQQVSASGGDVETLLIQGAIPLVMAKPVNEDGPLIISTNAVELGDIPQTVFSELGLPAAGSGFSFFDKEPSSDRIRYHRFYRYAGWGQDYLLPMMEYAISGFSWDPDSWAPMGQDLNQLAAASFAGELIVLGKGGNLADYPHEGWSAPRVEGRTILGKDAFIEVPGELLTGATGLEIRMNRKFSSSRTIPLMVFVGDVLVEDWVISKSTPNKILASIPSFASMARKNLKLRFELGEDGGKAGLVMEIRILHGP